MTASDASGGSSCYIRVLLDNACRWRPRPRRAALPKWPWLQRFIALQNWETKVRTIDAVAKPHPKVRMRFDLPTVVQCAAGVVPYRPDALAHHDEFKHYYSSPVPEAGTAPAGPNTPG